MKHETPKLTLIVDRDVFSTDEEWLEALERSASLVASGPGSALQVRLKGRPPEQRRHLLRAARRKVAPIAPRAILNGSTEEAVTLGFSRVHWPEALIPERRGTAPGELTATASVHSLDAARKAARAGAIAVQYGPVFDPGSKPASGRGLLDLQKMAGRSPLPVIAIGGITVGRIHSCINAGATGVAIITHILRALDPGAAFLASLRELDVCRRQMTPARRRPVKYREESIDVHRSR